MSHSFQLNNSPIIIPFGNFNFYLSSYTIECGRSFSTKFLVDGNSILHNQGLKPTILTISGKFSKDDSTPAPILYEYIKNKTTFSLTFNNLSFSGLFLTEFVCNESSDLQYSEYTLKFISSNPVTEA